MIFVEDESFREVLCFINKVNVGNLKMKFNLGKIDW